MPGIQGPITLRLRVALFSGITLLSVSFALVLFINIAATVTAPNSQTAGLPRPQPQTALPQATPISGIGMGTAGAPTVTPIGLGTTAPISYSAPETEYIRHTVLGELQVISAIGMLFVIVVGSLAAYWAAGRALRPLTRISRTAQAISANNLDTRLALKAPDQEVKELGEALDTMLGRLERSFAQQGQFASNVAHELRNPLTTLRTNVEVAQLDPSATVEDYQEMAEVLERTLTRLEKLVADLLLMARDEDALVQEDILLEALLQAVIAESTPLAKRHNVNLYFSSEATGNLRVRGDAVLLARAFANLVENGVRYNNPGGSVSVSLMQEANEARVLVEDTGIGIPTEYLAAVFERFYRVKQPRSSHQSGTGLGLSIVSHIVALHGGHVALESEAGIGSRFTVSLPITSTPQSGRALSS